MSDELSVRPAALNALKLRLQASDITTTDLLTPLRALQRIGLSKSDLQVHVERMRAVNDVTLDDPILESNAVLALDMIDGLIPVGSLSWDAATMARVFLPRVLHSDALRFRINIALEPSDLLPPRPNVSLSENLMNDLFNVVLTRLMQQEGGPQPASFFRVPKTGLTTRPAAMLTLEDRIVFEAFAGQIVEALGSEIDGNVVWPRFDSSERSYSSFASTPGQWNHAYLVLADIESFYECIDHVLLATFIGGQLGQTASYTRALEYFLDAVMSSTSGLPQGPAASEVFASAYLLAADEAICNSKWTFARFADDFLIGAESVVDARRKIEELESLLRELGLRLNVSKTKVMRREKYMDNLGKPSERIEMLRAEVLRSTEVALLESDDKDEVDEFLREIGVDEELLWDLFYHNTRSLEDVIEEIRENLRPPLVDAYAQYLSQVALELRDKHSDDMALKEQDLRECLLMLTSSGRKVNLSLIAEIVKWFPRLAQHTAIYLKSIANENASEVGMLISNSLSPLSDTDWVTAWLCNVPESCPDIVDDLLSNVLRSLVVDPQVGWLTRAGAVHALAAAGRLDNVAYAQVWSEATPAIRSELLWAQRQAEPNRYPELSPAIDQSASSRPES